MKLTPGLLEGVSPSDVSVSVLGMPSSLDLKLLEDCLGPSEVIRGLSAGLVISFASGATLTFPTGSIVTISFEPGAAEPAETPFGGTTSLNESKTRYEDGEEHHVSIVTFLEDQMPGAEERYYWKCSCGRQQNGHSAKYGWARNGGINHKGKHKGSISRAPGPFLPYKE